MNAYLAKIIETHFKFSYTYYDFFCAYCKAKGIENPEEDLTDEEYTAMEEEFDNKMKANKVELSKLEQAMIEELEFMLDKMMVKIKEGEWM